MIRLPRRTQSLAWILFFLLLVPLPLLAQTIRAKQVLVTDGQGSILRFPSLTVAQRDASSHNNGEVIYCTDCAPAGLYVFTAGSWVLITASAVVLPVASGGTGLSSLQAWSFLMGNNASAVNLLPSPLDVAHGGTHMTAGNSGGLVAFIASNQMSSSPALTQHGVLLGNGPGVTPFTTTSGSSNQVFRVPGAGPPAGFGAIDLSQGASVTSVLAAINGGSGHSSFAKGDVLVGINGGTLGKQTIGADGTVFTADSTMTTGTKWASVTPSAGIWDMRGFVSDHASATTVTMSAHAVLLRNPSDGSMVTRTATGIVTNDINVNQAGGSTANQRDINGASATAAFGNGVWVWFYWIWNGSTLATLSSSVAPPTGPTLPSGYTHWAFATVYYYDTVPILRGGHTSGNQFIYSSQHVILYNAPAQAIQQTQSVSGVVPAHALSWTLAAECMQTATTTTARWHFRYLTSNDFYLLDCSNVISNLDRKQAIMQIPNANQTFFHFFDASPNQTAFVHAIGYMVPNGGQ